MRRALELAARARGDTAPNPMVGAVVVDVDGRVVGEGWHEGAGEPHAEVVALEEARERARGATLYVTLEPCTHHGLTPPCVEAVIGAGVTRVVVAQQDPDPRVSGAGVEVLRAAGVTVVEAVCRSQAEAQLDAYRHHRTTGRPLVVLKTAITIDGATAAPDGSSQWITGEEARADAHELRRESDAVLVGSGTVVADDPRLDVRTEPPPRRQPLRVVADARGRTSAAAAL
ncbi:MAG: bifunctional diaminohydroxyphosphoribosylaminopyrimidine deaminase/5-amino-6-(5-phosphoribosylamino)uracil reductase RibD, partial [Acidimicrobiia bacterium]|nr:bifunctional diaminohydroxyphosphoribosylaminopyrimidine deaminase/5-amino-6-(5-phosphoribosylamino)uracil reductase RibD [Acidimicrobiia bacterium]